MIEGNFIVLEGIDGSGTTTQADALKKRFAESGLPAHVTAEPSTGPVGSMIRQILTGRLVIRKQGRSTAPNWSTMALLFAADRQDHVESEIAPNLRDGVNVICDRYVYSSIAYQSASSNSDDATDWIREINKYIRKPDLVLYLRVDPEEALQRREERDIGPEIYENPEFQKKLVKVYDEMNELGSDTAMITIDANQSIEQVTEACWAEVERLRG